MSTKSDSKDFYNDHQRIQKKMYHSFNQQTFFNIDDKMKMLLEHKSAY